MSERRDGAAREPRDTADATPPHQPNNPLHGVTLEMMLTQMVERFGWDGLARDVPIRCFQIDPSMTSALKYLRKAPRARKKVEEVYARSVAEPRRRSGGAPSAGMTRPSRRRT
jgi:uncharacterized protein (DUF2132 family)